MEILQLGFDHCKTRVELREKLAFGPQLLEAALQRLLQEADAVQEAVILSTCNRVEIYCVADDKSVALQQVKNFIARIHNIPCEEFERDLQVRSNAEAVEHLFSVAGSLKSMVLGENQIQGQIKQAFEMARKCRAAGPTLTQLFQTALKVGKRVRRETCINESSLSISHAAVNFLIDRTDAINDLNVLIIGKGKMGLMAVKALLKSGVRNVTLVNRTEESAKEIAHELGIEAYGFDHLERCLARADAVISSTAAPEPVLTTTLLRPVLTVRDARPLRIIDIAVPRDVEPEVATLPGITLHNIDHLKERIETSRAKRANEVSKVLTIIREEQDTFEQWLHTLSVKPIIMDLKKQAEQIREQELQRARRRLGAELSDIDSEVLEELTRRIINKMLHSPIVHLRKHAGDEMAASFPTTVRTLFGLEEASQPQEHGYSD